MRRRRLEMYPLLKQEIEHLSAGYSSPCLGFFGAFVGAFVSLLITVLTAPLNEPVKTRFVDATLITGIGTMVFLVFAGRDWWRARQLVANLKTEIVDVDVIQQPQGLP
jgi:hypothetical protein